MLLISSQTLSVLMQACKDYGMRLATDEFLFERWSAGTAESGTSKGIENLSDLLQYFKRETDKWFPNAGLIVLFLMKQKNQDNYSYVFQES